MFWCEVCFEVCFFWERWCWFKRVWTFKVVEGLPLLWAKQNMPSSGGSRGWSKGAKEPPFAQNVVELQQLCFTYSSWSTYVVMSINLHVVHSRTNKSWLKAASILISTLIALQPIFVGISHIHYGKLAGIWPEVGVTPPKFMLCTVGLLTLRARYPLGTPLS